MDKKKPKISVITVSYNSAAHIEQAIQSVISQGYDNKEYLVIDGGSTDGTVDIINKYRDKIDYFVSEPDKGISDAFNKGIKASTGDIIGILNSDDFMMPDALQKIADEYEPGVDIYRGYCMIWNEETGSKHELHPNSKFSIPPIGAVICHESSFISRERYKKTGLYKVDYKYAMDLDLFVRMYKDKNLKNKFVDVCVDTFRTGGASSSSASKLRGERKRLIIENDGSKFDAFIYILYYDLRYRAKIIRNFFQKYL